MTKHKAKIPNWFNISKYSSFELISSKSISQELYIRQYQYNFVQGNTDHFDKLTKKFIKKSIISTRISGFGMPFNYQLIEFLKEDWGDEYHIENFWSDKIPLPTLNQDKTDSSSLSMSVKRLSYKDINRYHKVPKKMLDLYIKNISTFEDLLDQYQIHVENNDCKSKAFTEVIKNMNDEYQITYSNLINSIDNCYEEFHTNEISDYVLPDSPEIRGSVNGFYIKFKLMFHETKFSKYIPEPDNQFLFSKIDLNAPDEIILNQLKKLISENRKLYKIEAPDNFFSKKERNKSNGGMKILKSIIEKRVIPFIDLLIWEKENNFDLSDEWFINAIYADYKKRDIDISHSRIYDTVMPHAKNCLNKQWLESFYCFNIESYAEFEKNPSNNLLAKVLEKLTPEQKQLSIKELSEKGII